MAVHTLTPMTIWKWCKKPKVIAAVIFAGFVSGTFVPYLVFGSAPDDPTCDDGTTADSAISRQLFSCFWT